jgi:hypothetical protein
MYQALQEKQLTVHHYDRVANDTKLTLRDIKVCCTATTPQRFP